jgi:2-dehydropantoate 2-reductase
MRGEHYETSIKRGLNVTSINGDIFIPPESLNAYKHTDEMGTADWVVVALKSTSLDAIPDLICPLLHRDTRVLVIMNGLVEDDLLCAMNEAGADFYAMYGGMALLCSNRLGPGRVDHSYAGFLSGGVATSKGAADSDREAFESLWKPTKVEIGYEESLLRGRWRKSLWNLPFNGISVAMGGITVDIIVNDPGLRRLADLVMDETIATANADLSSHGAPSSLYLGDEDVSRSPGAQVTIKVVCNLTFFFHRLTPQKQAMMDLSDNMGPYKTSTMLDLTQRNPMEVKYLFRKTLERAEQLGVAVPHLETLVAQIEAMQRIYKLF